MPVRDGRDVWHDEHAAEPHGEELVPDRQPTDIPQQ
jgi:hypothetical protein